MTKRHFIVLGLLAFILSGCARALYTSHFITPTNFEKPYQLSVSGVIQPTNFTPLNTLNSINYSEDIAFSLPGHIAIGAGRQSVTRNLIKSSSSNNSINDDFTQFH